MFNFKPKTEKKTGLSEVRDEAIAQLLNLDPTDPTYPEILAHVETLSKLMALETPEKLSRNTLAMVVGNVGVTAMIVEYERVAVVTSKALNFLQKLR